MLMGLGQIFIKWILLMWGCPFFFTISHKATPFFKYYRKYINVFLCHVKYLKFVSSKAAKAYIKFNPLHAGKFVVCLNVVC